MTDKLTIQAYHQDQAIERGKTTLPATADASTLQAKLQAAAKRAGLRKIDKIDVINPDGTVAETWTVDFENKVLHKSGAELSIPATPPAKDAGEQEKKPMAKKATAKKAAKKKATSNARTKAKSNGEGKGRGVGVIATIVDTIGRSKGASQDEIVEVLVKKFPDRGEDQMRATVKIQANKNAKKKEKDEKRGLVYYG